MNPYALDIFDGYLRAQGIWAALVSNPFTLTWLTGYAAPIETGPSPFEGGPALGWVQAGEVTLVVSNLETASASACGAKVQEYVGYTIDEPLRGTRQMGEALGAVLKGRAGARGRVGVEMDTLAAPLLTSLAEALPRCGLVPVDEAVAGLRAVKSSEEIAKLRKVLAVCDQAQAIVRHCLRAGASELELWGQVRGEIEAHVGGRLPALVDFVAGPRTAEIGGPPGGYVLHEGDALMLDFVARLDGYWGDNTDMHPVGTMSEPLAGAYRTAREALQSGIDAVRPGQPAGEIDGRMRAFVRRAGFDPYPHHSGHGIGTSYHEEPRIVPYNTSPLKPGMVLALEPGIYLPGIGGVRVEDVVLVTDDGAEVLTRHLARLD